MDNPGLDDVPVPFEAVVEGVRSETGEPWADGSPHPVGHGASVRGDGASSLLDAEAATRFSATEVRESKNPWLLQKIGLAADAGGARTLRGGLGVDRFLQVRDDRVTAAVEPTKTPRRGLEGRQRSVPSIGALVPSDGAPVRVGKTTRLHCPRGSTLELHTGIRGGYGPTNERNPGAVRADVREHQISDEQARGHQPDAFPGRGRV